jgi:hypothetical protein
LLKSLYLQLLFFTTFLLTTNTFAMEPEMNFTDLPVELRGLTVRRAAYQQCLEDDAPVTIADTLRNLALVCTEWL